MSPYFFWVKTSYEKEKFPMATAITVVSRQHRANKPDSVATQNRNTTGDKKMKASYNQQSSCRTLISLESHSLKRNREVMKNSTAATTYFRLNNCRPALDAMIAIAIAVVMVAPARAQSHGKEVVVSQNSNGRLEVVYVGTDDALYHNWQDPNGPGGWHGEMALSGFAKQVTVGQNTNGSLEVFYVGTDDAFYHNWQDPSGLGGWHGQAFLGGFAKQIVTMRNLGGRLEVFYVGTDNALYHNWQDPSGRGGWRGEASLGGSAKQITVGQNSNGSLEAFYVGTNEALYHNWQDPNGLGGLAWEESLTPTNHTVTSQILKICIS